jgi:hypothetical protein
MTSDNTPVTAALAQLAAHHEQLTQLDTRETGHHAAVTERLAEITDLVTAIRCLVDDHQAELARIEGVDWKVPDVAAQLAGTAPASTGPTPYRPGPAPAWWKLPPADRQEPIARLRAWVEQVYRPGYGHLAATLGPCWESHDLCLYGLDILSNLWSALYLQPRRSAGLLTAQAEYQSRILPALTDQLRLETNRCGHPHTRPASVQPRSMP